MHGRGIYYQYSKSAWVNGYFNNNISTTIISRGSGFIPQQLIGIFYIFKNFFI